MSFLENTRKPGGIGGKMMVSFMNVGHRALTGWGLRFLHPLPDAHVLDCGCGGGANIKRLLKKMPARHRQGCGLFRSQRRESPEFKPDCHSEGALRGVAGQRGTHHLCQGLV